MNSRQTAPRPARAEERPPVWRTIAGFSRPVWFLLLGMFINKFGTFVLPFLALHVQRLGYTTGQCGLALGAYGAGHLIASALGGHLADTLGRRRTIVASMVCGAACMVALSQARDFWVLTALALLTGLTGEFYRPAGTALLADLVGENQRLTAFAAYRFAINAGFAFGPAVAACLARQSYFWLFVGDAATSALYGLIAALFLPNDKPRQNWRYVLNGVRSLREAGRAAAADRRFVQLVVASLAVGMVFVQLLSTFGLEVRAAGLPDQVYGLVLSLNGLLVVMFEIPLTAVTRRYSPRGVIAFGFALIGCGTGLYAWAETAWQYALSMTVFTAGEIASMPVAMAYVVSLAPEDMRGRYVGLYGLTWATALVCGPALGTMLFAWSPAALWIGCGATGLLAAAIMLRDPRQP